MKPIIKLTIPAPLRLILLLTLTACCAAGQSTTVPVDKRPSVLVVYAD